MLVMAHMCGRSLRGIVLTYALRVRGCRILNPYLSLDLLLVQSEATPKKFIAFLGSVGRASSKKGLWRLTSMQFRMLPHRFGFQDKTSFRYNLLINTQSFKHGIAAVSCEAQSHLTQQKTSLIIFDRKKYKVPFADGLNGRFGHDRAGRAGNSE